MKSDESTSALRAILFADAVEYSRHMEAHEHATAELMQRCFSLFRSLATTHGGEVLKTMGDGVMVEFVSATEAVLYALAAQENLASLEENLPGERQIQFRMGIHLGEVRHRDGDVYGHIVNVAARLERIAEPGGICISQSVFEQVRENIAASYGSLGRRALRNLPQPMVAYRVIPHDGGLRERRIRANSSGIAVSLIERVTLTDLGGNELALKSTKAQALVCYLVMSQHQKELKNRILGLLWSNHDPEQARQECKSVIRQIQHVFQSVGSDAFRSNPDEVHLILSTLQVDLFALSEQLDEGSVAPEFFEGRVTPEHLMDGLDGTDQVFDAWLKVTRHRWRDRLIEKLEACLERHSPDRLSNKHAATALLAIDPTHEPAARVLMQIFAAEGRNAAALRVYQSLNDVLTKDYGIEPSVETQKIVQLIRAGRSVSSGDVRPPPAAPSVPAQGRLPVIEVRHFHGSENQREGHLLAGFRSEIIACLIKFRDWVIVEEHDDAHAHIPKLNGSVDYRLEARIVPGVDDNMVSVSLVDAMNDRFVWVEQYPISLRDWGNISGNIARRTAAVLEIYLSAERVAGYALRHDLSLSAYDDWLRGENLLTLWQPEAEIEAEGLFKSVIEKMPQFAPAYSSLASIYNVRHLIVAGFRRDPALEAEALRLAQKAVQFDPLETRAHLTLAWSYAMAGRYEQADIHYDLAFDLNPNNPKTLISCAHGLAFTGRVERSQELVQLALGLTPIVAPYQWAYLAGIRFVCADYPGCISAATMGTGSLIDTFAWKAAALSHMGHVTEARSAAAEFLSVGRTNWSEPEPTDEQIVFWVLQAFPIKDDETRSRLARGLEAAGLPVG